MSERKLIGFVAILIGSAIAFPKETGMILEAISKTNQEKTASEIKVNEVKPKPIEKLGLIRRTKKNILGFIGRSKKTIITNANKFWKWLY
jgi:hypothetical protein